MPFVGYFYYLIILVQAWLWDNGELMYIGVAEPWNNIEQSGIFSRIVCTAWRRM